MVGKKNQNGKLSCKILLFKNDKDLVQLLSRYGNIGSEYREFHGYLPTVNSLSEDWKELPESPTRNYALGFILGLISADGHICKSTSKITISQTDLEDIIEFRKLAIYAGLRAREVRLGVPPGVGFENSKQSYRLTISSYNLTQNHFLRKDHKKNFKVSNNYRTIGIRNIDLKDKIKEEEVFKVHVPSYCNFALADFTIIGT